MRALALFLTLLFASVGARAQVVAVPAPLTGTVTLNPWQAFDSSYPGITLACGKPFHYVMVQPPQYNPTLYKYPLYIWMHPDHSGDAWYQGKATALAQSGNEAGSYNTVAFQTRHPAFYAAPSADQNNGPPGAANCGGQGDSSVKNWGGWFNNGSVGSGTNYSGDSGPNTFAVIAMVNEIIAHNSIDTTRIYINGFSLGGIYTDYACLHYNAYNGDKGRIFAACAGSAGVNQADSPPSGSEITALRDVPQWMFSGANDGASPPGSWNTPLCTALGGNPASLTGITSAAANRCGTSQMRYTLCPNCGHQDTDAFGGAVWANQIINDFLFAQSSTGAIVTPPGGGCGGGAESTDQTSVTTVGALLTDANHSTFAISSGGQILICGTADGSTSNVVQLAYVNHVVWQKNTVGNWYSYQGSPGSYAGPTTTSPLTGGNPPPVITGHFHVSGGKILAPDGSIFKGVGINIGDFRANLDMASAVTNFTTGAPLTTLFPGINFVRVALYGGGSVAAPTTYPAASSYDAFVNTMSALHIVVEFEHHIGTTGSSAGGGQGVVPAAGSAWVNAENANYAALALRFKDNPYVWFGTNNEPPSATGLSEWQKSSYDAIRGTGNVNPIMLEVWGSRPPGYGGTPLQQGMVQSIYSAMTNIVWDPHVYPFINGNNTSAASNNQTPIDMAAAAQTITSADGVVPVIIGEFGPSTTGSSIEANATATVTGVLASGFGSAVWHWGQQDCCNNLNSGNTLTALGVQVAAAIAANAPGSPPPGPGPFTESADQTTVTTVGPIITDATGNTFAISSGGLILINGTADGTTANVTELAYVNHVVWQLNLAGNWYNYLGSPGAYGGPTTTSPLTTINCGGGGTGQFSVTGGQVIDPNGNTFVAHGINVDGDELAAAITNTAAQPLTAQFPHINFIRVPIRSTSGVGTASAVYPDPATYAPQIARATALGIVVEFEDHNSNGGQWECFIPGGIGCTASSPPTGGALTTMLNFWKNLATLYKGNPYVWIGSLNEINSADGSYSLSAIAATTTYESALYNAVRSVGNNNMIQMGNGIGGGNDGTVGVNSGQTVSTVATWHNITWYMHRYYTDGTQAGAMSYLTGSAAACCGGSGGTGYTAAQTLHSGDGVVPVIIDECGSGSGDSGNGDASSIVSGLGSLHASGIGFACWAWYPSTQWQMIINGNIPGGPFSRTTWGNQISTLIATLPAPVPGGTGGGTCTGHPGGLIFGANDNVPADFFREAR